jgi:hypothetical protein
MAWRIMRRRAFKTDQTFIDWADGFVQDLVASFSSYHPTAALRLAVAGLYLFAGLHLVFAAVIPFYRGAIEGVIGSGTSGIAQAELHALTTGIVIGGVSFHALLMVSYFLMSFIVRAARRWTRIAGTCVLAINFAVALNGLRTPAITPVFFLFQWLSLVIATTIVVLLWFPRPRDAR